METQVLVTSMDKLVREAAQGHIEIVKDFILKYPDKVRMIHSCTNCHRNYDISLKYFY